MDPYDDSGSFSGKKIFYQPPYNRDRNVGYGSESESKKNSSDKQSKKKGLESVNSLSDLKNALNAIKDIGATRGEYGGRKFVYEGVEHSMNDIVKCYLRLVEGSNLTDSTQRDLTIQVMKKLRKVDEKHQLKTDNLTIGQKILLSVKQLGGKEIDKLESKLKSAIKKGVNSHSSWDPHRKEELINDMTTKISLVNQQKVNMSMNQKIIKELEKMYESKSFSKSTMPEIRGLFKGTKTYFQEKILRNRYNNAIENQKEGAKEPIPLTRKKLMKEYKEHMKNIKKELYNIIEAKTKEKKADFSKKNPTKVVSGSELNAIDDREEKDKGKVKILLNNKLQLYALYLDKLEASIKLDTKEAKKEFLPLEEPKEGTKKEEKNEFFDSLINFLPNAPKILTNQYYVPESDDTLSVVNMPSDVEDTGKIPPDVGRNE
jgi:hypothetical protein